MGKNGKLGFGERRENMEEWGKGGTNNIKGF